MDPPILKPNSFPDLLHKVVYLPPDVESILGTTLLAPGHLLMPSQKAFGTDGIQQELTANFACNSIQRIDT